MKRKKRPITILEIMIVILLIALIGSVIGYSMKGSLEKGKIFKTKQAIERIKEILYVECSEDSEKMKKAKEPDGWKSIIRKSVLTKKSEDLLKDAWGGEFKVTYTDEGGFEVECPNLNKHKG